MNVRTVCLAILHDGEASGYEIRKRSTEREFAYFAEASYGSIYPALARLEGDKLVTCRVEHQDGRPAKKIYAITQKGRRTFKDELLEKLHPDTFRSEFIMFARFAALVPADVVETRLDERIADFDEKLEHVTKLLAEHTNPADRWTLNFAVDNLEAARTYVVNNKHKLIALALPNEAAPQAAQ